MYYQAAISKCLQLNRTLSANQLDVRIESLFLFSSVESKFFSQSFCHSIHFCHWKILGQTKNQSIKPWPYRAIQGRANQANRNFISFETVKLLFSMRKSIWLIWFSFCSHFKPKITILTLVGVPTRMPANIPIASNGNYLANAKLLFFSSFFFKFSHLYLNEYKVYI